MCSPDDLVIISFALSVSEAPLFVDVEAERQAEPEVTGVVHWRFAIPTVFVLHIFRVLYEKLQ